MLFIIDHASRAVHIAGITTNPNRVCMTQMALELTDPIDGFLRNKRYLILDNDILFKDRFSSMLEDEGVKVVHTGYQAPDMNAFAERWRCSRLRGALGEIDQDRMPEQPDSSRQPIA